MPIYEFRCLACRNIFEAILTSSTAESEVSCPKCSSKDLRKIISATSFRISSSAGSTAGGALSGCSSKGGFS